MSKCRVIVDSACYLTCRHTWGWCRHTALEIWNKTFFENWKSDENWVSYGLFKCVTILQNCISQQRIKIIAIRKKFWDLWSKTFPIMPVSFLSTYRRHNVLDMSTMTPWVDDSPNKLKCQTPQKAIVCLFFICQAAILKFFVLKICVPAQTDTVTSPRVS